MQNIIYCLLDEAYQLHHAYSGNQHTTANHYHADIMSMYFTNQQDALDHAQEEIRCLKNTTYHGQPTQILPVTTQYTSINTGKPITERVGWSLANAHGEILESITVKTVMPHANY